MLTPVQMARMSQLLDEALDLSPEGRVRWLGIAVLRDGVCLRRALDRLVRFSPAGGIRERLKLAIEASHSQRLMRITRPASRIISYGLFARPFYC
jgi:hypothetical protein